MKTKYNKLFLVAIAFLSLTLSCSKEDLVDPPSVILNIDWTNRTEGIAIPVNYKVIIDGRTITYREASNMLPQLKAGVYPVSIYNIAEKITIKGTTASVATNKGIIDSQPGWLFYSGLDVAYENDEKLLVTAVMQQQVRQLDIELDITEGNPDDIKTITASLSGVANSLDMKNKTYSGTGLKVTSAFTHNADKLKASVRLLGLTSEVQNLILDITYKNGKQQQIVSDISDKLAGFNANKYKPVILKGDAEIWSRVDFETIISEWEIQGTINGDAEEQV